MVVYYLLVAFSNRIGPKYIKQSNTIYIYFVFCFVCVYINILTQIIKLTQKYITIVNYMCMCTVKKWIFNDNYNNNLIYT